MELVEGDTMETEALHRRLAKLGHVLEVARTLANERDLDSILASVLRAAALVAEADRSSIFLLDRERGELWTRLAQGVAATQEIRTPLGVGIAGHVAATGEAINIPRAYDDPRFNRSVDQATGYLTESLLTVPMRLASGKEAGQVVGVLQVLNRRDGKPFNAEDQELLEGLGAQAGAVIENTILQGDIQRLFEGFVHASVVAIESRDPTTAGHSDRVARLTVNLANTLAGVETGPYARLRFSTEQLQELRYAALLHDFGKVGVREHVLVKANKLYPQELSALESRFDFIHRTIELQSARRKADLLAGRGPSSIAAALLAEDERLSAELAELAERRAFILSCNRPNVLDEGGYERLHELRALHFEDTAGRPQSYLSDVETARLSIRKGSLSEDERREIESHVTHTFQFLSQIPWTRGLKRVPEIAHGHHEKLDGSGYPLKLRPEQIAVETRMMTVSDIYDALTASDRPYKRAMPHERALDILASEAARGLIDAELLRIFMEARVPQSTLG
jgi:HD-GYP domain-containing protein (c-di-GMP phosphodiesterase class II)